MLDNNSQQALHNELVASYTKSKMLYDPQASSTVAQNQAALASQAYQQRLREERDR